MIVNNIPIAADLIDILLTLQTQLHADGINLLHDIKDGPDNIMVTCPYHKGGQERRPSAGIRKSDGIFHCFTCDETHSLQEFISYCFGRYDDVLGSYGWEWILKNFVTVGIEERKDIPLDLLRHSQPDTVYVSESELDKYRMYHPYMWKRKLTPQIVDIFDIGYDKETQCITFPIRDETGRCLFVARRSVVTKFFHYPSGAKKPVYGLYELSQLISYPREVIICESMLDALTCWVYGSYAVALNGLGNDLQFTQLNKMPCRKFILATDNDDAGYRARVRIKSHIRNKIVTEYELPRAKKDINDLTLEEFIHLREIF